MAKTRNKRFRIKKSLKNRRKRITNKKMKGGAGEGDGDGKRKTIVIKTKPGVELPTESHSQTRPLSLPPTPTPNLIQPENDIIKFWTEDNSFFTKEELNGLKSKIEPLMNNNEICNVIQQIDKYKIKDTEHAEKLYYNEYKKHLCLIMTIYGILSIKMAAKGKYNLIFKGGKAMQLVFTTLKIYAADVCEIRHIDNPTDPQLSEKDLVEKCKQLFNEYAQNESDDIDVLIMPKNPNEPIQTPSTVFSGSGSLQIDIENFSLNIANLIVWLSSGYVSKTGDFVNQLSILKPSYNPNIYKISLQYDVNGFVALTDIDFLKPNPNVIDYFTEEPNLNKLIILPNENVLNQYLLFKSPNIESIFQEKLYYYIYYNILKIIPNNQNECKKIGKNVDDVCVYNLKKIKKALQTIIKVRAFLLNKPTSLFIQDYKNKILELITKIIQEFNNNVQYTEEKIQKIKDTIFNIKYNATANVPKYTKDGYPKYMVQEYTEYEFSIPALYL